jgi:eukaryotic-like serine/threonine-protein kinase
MNGPDEHVAGELDPERWRRLKTIFHAALERPTVERPAFIEQACEGDKGLQTAVLALVANDRESGGLLGTHANIAVATGGASPRVDLRLAAAPNAQPLELQALLHQRLRVLVLVLLTAQVWFSGFRFLRLNVTSVFVWRMLLPASLFVAVLVVMAALLWRKRIYTLADLRWFEGILFGAATVYFVNETYVTLFVEPYPWLITYVQRHPTELSFLARAQTMIWMALLVAYGTFVPNTARRCALVSGAIALTPIGVVGAAGWLNGVATRPLLLFLSDLVLWLGIGTAIAIYGSHKISVLREQALSARKLGQYQLKKQLARGGMGEVYLAEHVLLKRPCAVKVIRAEQAGKRWMLERFLREVQATAALTHPNTVQIFDYGQADDGTVYYAMEYLAGLNLDQAVKRDGPFPSSRVIFVLRQLCGALAEAHDAGLIHRDIKPTNVILSSRGGLHDVAKLLDFGLARMQSENAAGNGLTQPGLIFGTPEYMSPEQAAGKDTLDARSDIYSLGALAYFLITGRPPFVRKSVVETLAAQINDPVLPLGDDAAAPDDLEAVILRCLAKQPENRFPDVRQLELTLASCRSAGEWTSENAAAWWHAAASIELAVDGVDIG